jgi:1-acyl-sn-glycerol-3-phosphate acyltransferase
MGKERSYSQLQDSQLTWPHMVAQWICIHLMEVYFRYKYKLQILGKENQPKGWQSYVVAANHISALDPPLVSLALDFQPISYLAKTELFEKPLMRIYNVWMSSIAVNRDKLELSTVKSALKVLKHGQWALGIFPEGTRNTALPGEKVGESKKGVAYFAKTAKVPVLPLGIYRGNGRLEIRIGKLIPSDCDLDELGAKIQIAIADLVAEADLV